MNTFKITYLLAVMTISSFSVLSLNGAAEPQKPQEATVLPKNLEEQPDLVFLSIVESLSDEEVIRLSRTSKTVHERLVKLGEFERRKNLVNYWSKASIHGHIFKTLSAIISSLAYSPDGKTIASGSWDNLVQLYDVATSNILWQHRCAATTSRINRVAFSPDGQQLVFGPCDNAVQILNLKNLIVLEAIRSTMSNFNVAWFPHGRILALFDSADEYTVQGTIIDIYGVAFGKPTRIAVAPHTIYATAFSPDGKVIASGSKDNVIRLWNIHPSKTLQTIGDQLKDLKGHTGIIETLVFSPDGNILASASWDGTIRLWNTHKNTQPKILNHGRQATALAFSPDGRILASGASDGSIRLWNAQTGEQIKELDGHTASITSLVFSANGKILISGSYDQTIRIWKAETPAPKELQQ